jgi:hypothetical protein
VIPEFPTDASIRVILEKLTVYTWYDSETGQDCGETIIWADDFYTPPYESARW